MAGKSDELAKKMDVSTSGLLIKLADKEIINSNQREIIEVSIIVSIHLRITLHFDLLPDAHFVAHHLKS